MICNFMIFSESVGSGSLSLRKRPGGRLGCKRYSFATFLFFGGNEFIRSVSGSSVVRTADGRVLAGICGSSVGRGKAGRNSIFVLSVGSWGKVIIRGFEIDYPVTDEMFARPE